MFSFSLLRRNLIVWGRLELRARVVPAGAAYKTGRTTSSGLGNGVAVSGPVYGVAGGASDTASVAAGGAGCQK